MNVRHGRAEHEHTFYTLMFDAVEEHGGLVAQMAGDGFMAVFGAPTLRPDHALLAVRAGLEMLDLIELFAAEQEAQGKPRIRIGVGVASGSVVAGYTGTQHRATYTCVGDVVNVAARLEPYTKEIGDPSSSTVRPSAGSKTASTSVAR